VLNYLKNTNVDSISYENQNNGCLAFQYARFSFFSQGRGYFQLSENKKTEMKSRTHILDTRHETFNSEKEKE
jgi:hypothetical protein